jgi:hypothetical protein
MFICNLKWVWLIVGLAVLLPLGTADAQDADPITIEIIRNDGETLTLYIPGSGIVSLAGLTFEVTNDDQVATRSLDEFPSLQGFQFDRVVLPACFHFTQTRTRQPVPIECQQNVPSNQVQVERLPVPFWYDLTFLQPYLLTVTNGLDVMGECPAQQFVCTIEYTADAPAINGEPELPTMVLPTSGSLVVQGETRFRAAPAPDAELVDVRTGGTFFIVGISEDGSYYQVDLNGTPVWVSTTALNVTAKIDEGAAPPDMNAVTTGPGPHTIAIGESVNGVLASNETARFNMIGLAGEEVSVIVDAEFDSTLALYSVSLGNVPLVEADDAGGTDDPRIDGFILQTDDTYLLDVAGFSSGDSGAYTITVQRGGLQLAAGGQRLTPGNTIIDTLPVAEAGIHCFEATGGDVISLQAEALFDSYLQLTDSNGEIIASDDEGGGHGNPHIRLFPLPFDDEYCAVVRAFDSNQTGAYRLTLETGITGVTIPLFSGDVLEDTLNEDNQSIFTFEANSGEQVSFFVESSFDGVLELRGETGELLAEDDDSAGNLQPALSNIPLGTTGRYFIILSTFGEVENGQFTVTFNLR